MNTEQNLDGFLAQRAQNAPEAEKIFILGGGAAGMFTAYQLLKNYPQKNFTVVVFDGTFRKKPIGGNAYTLPVMVDGQQRWVDLGVNDLNRSAYINTFKVIADLNRNGIKVETRKLLDTTVWAGSHNGRYWEYSYEDMEQRRPNAPDIYDEYRRFAENAYYDWINDYQQDFNISVEQYCDQKGYSCSFRNLNLYPRINGMYYVDWSLPAKDMPLGAVMKYYHFQEGFGGHSKPDRHYFVNGSSHWMRSLAIRIRQLGGYVCHNTVVIDVEEAEAGQGIVLTTIATGAKGDDFPHSYQCERLVFACHADTAAAMLKKQPGTKALVHQLNKFYYNHNPDMVVAHRNKRWLPVKKHQPGAFNVTIHPDYQRPNPYVMSYCSNYHQNDPVSGKKTPLFYVTVNPDIARDGSDNDKILKTPDGELAIAHFRHNTETPQVREAQQFFLDNREFRLFGGKVYFSGGWLVGAGLHEECYESAQRTVHAICDIKPAQKNPPGMAAEDAYLLQAMNQKHRQLLGIVYE